MAVTYSRKIFEMLLKKLFYGAFQKYPTKGESFASKMLKMMERKKVIGNFRRAWKINQTCNEWSHYNPSKEKKSIEEVLVLISKFAKEECGIELEVPSSKESSIFREMAAMKAEIEDGGFYDSPDICPHCNNFIGYIEWKVELDHQLIQGSMEWRKEHDRNYCPFCLKKEYIPVASKEIQFPFNLEFEEHWVRTMDDVIRQDGRQAAIANHGKWLFETTNILYVAEFGGSGELDFSLEPLNIEADTAERLERPPPTLDYIVGSNILHVFRLLEKLYLHPGDVEIALHGGYVKLPQGGDLHNFEWNIELLDTPEEVVSKIPKMYMDFMNIRLVPYDKNNCTVQVFPHYECRGERNEEIDFSVIHHNGVYRILKEVFDLYGDSKLDIRGIFNGLTRLDCEQEWDLPPRDSSPEISIGALPDYCHKWLDYSIEKIGDIDVVLFSLKTDIELMHY